ncbi:uncharacterized protein LOC113225838 [Hyposmocoma kahamanoa]|uniref:uncharacterized protein LOC113225838 n=1 Tax=Hyposmocoma kahamanoa TaxID=1477025 RepID=UPI000E6D925A|nr:uncharacterized protein LOC113225838 [Hyposmocoma kahamanoa]
MDIARIFHKCLLEYTLADKIQGITVENATANTKLMYELGKLLPHFDSDNQHFRCIAHILNLGVQDLLNNLALNIETYRQEQEQQCEDEDEQVEEYVPNISDSSTAITKLRSICSKIKRSEMLKRKFQSACETAGEPTNVSLILNCPTRWNSTHDIIGLCLKLKPGINILCTSVSDLSNFVISEIDWKILEKIYKFLINFKLLTTKLGGEKYVTLPLVIVSFNLLLDKIEAMIKQLDDKPNRTEVDERLILGFQAAQNKMLKHYRMINWIYCTTFILDPRHKSQTFEMTLWGQQLKSESLRKFEELYKEYKNLHAVPGSPGLPRHDNEVCEYDEDEDVIDFNKLYACPSTSSGSGIQRFNNNEFEDYLYKPRAASSEDILQW